MDEYFETKKKIDKKIKELRNLTEKFKELAREEKKQYPESTSFMDFLLKRGG